MQLNARCILYSAAVAGFLGLGIGSGTVYWWYARQPVRVKTLVGPTKTVIVKEKVYIGQKAIRYIPKAVKRNTHAHVVAGTVVHHRQVTAVVDTLSGITSLYVQPRSFFSSSNRTSVGLYEGVLNGYVDTRLSVSERVFRVGGVHVDLHVGLDTAAGAAQRIGYFLGAGLVYRW